MRGSLAEGSSGPPHTHPHHPQLLGTSFATFCTGTDFVHWRDSFYVRLLGGCGWKPTCAQADTEAAVSALDYFSAVLISDDGVSYAAGAKVGRGGHGWQGGREGRVVRG